MTSFGLTTLNADGSPHVTSVGAPWHVYEVRPSSATAVGTSEEAPGSMRWRW